MSHSVHDAEVVLGVREIFETFGYDIYVDWIDDPSLDRTSVDRSTAITLRRRMRQCKALIYIHTESSGESRWMPWELGFFDGFRSRVAILPIVMGHQVDFHGVEYIGIYPYLDVARLVNTNRREFWVNRSPKVYGLLQDWLDDPGAIVKRGD